MAVLAGKCPGPSYTSGGAAPVPTPLGGSRGAAGEPNTKLKTLQDSRRGWVICHRRSLEHWCRAVRCLGRSICAEPQGFNIQQCDSVSGRCWLGCRGLLKMGTEHLERFARDVPAGYRWPFLPSSPRSCHGQISHLPAGVQELGSLELLLWRWSLQPAPGHDGKRCDGERSSSTAHACSIHRALHSAAAEAGGSPTARDRKPSPVLLPSEAVTV